MLRSIESSGRAHRRGRSSIAERGAPSCASRVGVASAQAKPCARGSVPRSPHRFPVRTHSAIGRGAKSARKITTPPTFSQLRTLAARSMATSANPRRTSQGATRPDAGSSPPSSSASDESALVTVEEGAARFEPVEGSWGRPRPPLSAALYRMEDTGWERGGPIDSMLEKGGRLGPCECDWLEAPLPYMAAAWGCGTVSGPAGR